jgi:hypothetical protein
MSIVLTSVFITGVFMCSQVNSELIETQLFELASDIPTLNEPARLWFLSQGSSIVDILIDALEDRRLGSVGHWRILLLLRSFAQEKTLPAVLKYCTITIQLLDPLPWKY